MTDERSTAAKLYDAEQLIKIMRANCLELQERADAYQRRLNDERAARHDAEIRLEALRQRVAAAIAPYADLRR